MCSTDEMIFDIYSLVFKLSLQLEPLSLKVKKKEQGGGRTNVKKKLKNYLKKTS